jgi:hypothetical protein
VPRSYLKRFVNVVDRGGDGLHANLVGTSLVRLDRFGVDVLEELKATVTATESGRLAPVGSWDSIEQTPWAIRQR